MQKRVLSLLLAVIFTLTSFAGITVFAEDSTHVEFLKAMGAIDSKFSTTGTVTRGQFVDLIVKMLYQDVSFETSTDMASPFKDVYADTLYFANIKAAKDMKIINGDTYNNFYPDRAITMTEAVVMLINAYAYTDIANAKGGYPTGYVTVAKEINMLKGISMSDEPTGDTLLKLVYNSLFADVIAVDSIDGNGNVNIVKVSGVDTLSERFNIRKYIGVVYDNGITALDGVSLNYDDRVVLKLTDDGSKITARVNDDSIFGYLGSKVTAFIKYDELTNDYMLISFSLYPSSDEITIKANQITNVSTSYIEYKADENSISTAKLNLETPRPRVLYNGVLLTTYSSDTFKPKSGYVRLVDTDNNGKYDLVDIISFNFREYTDSDSDGSTDDLGMDSYGNIYHDNDTWNVVADVIDTENGYITCMQNPGINNIDIDEDNSIVRFILNDDVKSIGDVKSGDVISVALAPKKVNGKSVYYLAVNDETVSGTVTSYTASTITVGGKEYDVSSTILSSFGNVITVNEANEFKLDILGEITYVVKAAGNSKNYAYLINAKVTNSYENQLYVQLLTKDGKIEYLYGADNITIDGVRVSGAAAQLSKIAERYDDLDSATLEGKITGDTSISRPIIYTVNSDKLLTKIDTDTPNAVTASPSLLYKSMSPIPYSEEEVENYDSLKAGLRYSKTTKFIPAQLTFDGRFYIDANTVVFCVPDIDTYGLRSTGTYISSGLYSGDTPDLTGITMNEIYPYEKETSVWENYKVILPSAISTITRYDAQAYDIDPKTGVAGLLVIRGDDGYGYGGYSTTNNLNVVLKITDAYDEQREKTVKKIYYTKNGTTRDSALVDLDSITPAMRYIIEGVDGASNSFSSGTTVPALEPGDIVRIEKSNEYVSYIDRVVISTQAKIDTIEGLLGTPNALRKGYNNVGSQASEYAVQPYDMNTLNGTSTYQLVKPYAISGNALSVYLPKKGVPYSSLDVTDISKYTSLFYNMANVPITVVNITVDGTGTRTGAVTVKPGSVNDIRFDDTNSYLLLCTSSYAVKHGIVFNFEQ